ncbi:MAG: hypothetical protein KatS3mg014_2504 [Actinomycetota bacterium]|nr:MAG: hypothetical protein KatS3mg014_2501 [Actinomycetota bacterium]GIV00889.1 MAG: hypothetical protein KatS3mg014_2504 [Actinomycetota bacterium]
MRDAVNIQAAVGFWPRVRPTWLTQPAPRPGDRTPSDLRCPDCREYRYSRAPGAWLWMGCRCT